MPSVESRRITRITTGESGDIGASNGPDHVAIEEPLEIEVDDTVVSTTMRSPGHDIELALGWLVSEGIITSAEDVVEARECFDRLEDDVRRTVKVVTLAKRALEPRLHPTTSACGVCGTDVIDLTRRTRSWHLEDDPATFALSDVTAMPATMRAAQRGFDASGGLHAAALFTPGGELLCLREDVGRHNAVDKVVGWALQQGRLPLRGLALQVSGRASAELAHKAVVAGAPLLSAVSAPTTLAVDLARDSGLALVGFVRADGLNIYAGDRVR